MERAPSTPQACDLRVEIQAIIIVGTAGSRRPRHCGDQAAEESTPQCDPAKRQYIQCFPAHLSGVLFDMHKRSWPLLLSMVVLPLPIDNSYLFT
jgi:hypothetical protein